MKKYFFLLLALPFVLFFVSCKKDNGGTGATDIASIIDITKPATGIIYINGTVLPIEGLMIDDNGLTTARVEIRNKSTGTILNQQSFQTGNITAYSFNWNWTVAGMTSQITATVKVTAKDKLNNEVFKELDITLSN